METYKNYYTEMRVGKNPHIREKFEKYGMKNISTQELLMLILGSGVKNCPIEELSKEVLDVLEYRDSEELFSRLCAIRGMGKSKASLVCACIELGNRLCSKDKKVIKRPSDVLPIVQHYALEDVEYFICISLNGAGEIIKIKEISKGSSNSAMIHPKEVFSQVLLDHGSAVIFVHNHPSGNIMPSKEDMELTRRLIGGGKILGINTLDHIIITVNNYFSFEEHDYMQKLDDSDGA